MASRRPFLHLQEHRVPVRRSLDVQSRVTPPEAFRFSSICCFLQVVGGTPPAGTCLRRLSAPDWTKSHNPSQSCRQGAARPCLRGNCQSCWCRWGRKPARENPVGTWLEPGWNPRAVASRQGRPFWRQLTSGVMGGVKVPFLKPSQLNPSNHLNTEH